MKVLPYLFFGICGMLFATLGGAIAAPVSTESARFEPGPDDPRIAAAIAGRERLNAALVTGDVSVVDDLLATDFVVSSPIGRVVDRANLLKRVGTGEVRQAETVINLEFAGVRGDLVVLMGEEVVRPTASMPNAGSMVRRRFTDVWRDDDGTWKLAIRQSTIVAVE